MNGVRLDNVVSNSLLPENSRTWNASTTSLALKLSIANRNMWSSCRIVSILGEPSSNTRTQVVDTLPSQLNGIARGSGLRDLSTGRSFLENLSATRFPPVIADGFVGPGKNTTSIAWNMSDWIGIARSRSYVFSITEPSTYSDVDFSLLRFALENPSQTSL